MKHFHLGRCYAETDIRQSPCADLRSRVQRIGVYAYHSQPIMDLNALRLVIGIALPEPRAASDLEIRSVEVAAAIVELTMRR